MPSTSSKKKTRRNPEWKKFRQELLALSAAIGRARKDFGAGRGNLTAALVEIQARLDDLANTPPGTFPNVGEEVRR
jgi:hypothetical protein